MKVMLGFLIGALFAVLVACIVDPSLCTEIKHGLVSLWNHFFGNSTTK